VLTAAERQKIDQENTAASEKITNTVTIDPAEIPTEDLPAVEQMIEQSKEDGPRPLP